MDSDDPRCRKSRTERPEPMREFPKTDTCAALRTNLRKETEEPSEEKERTDKEEPTRAKDLSDIADPSIR